MKRQHTLPLVALVMWGCGAGPASPTSVKPSSTPSGVVATPSALVEDCALVGAGCIFSGISVNGNVLTVHLKRPVEELHIEQQQRGGGWQGPYGRLLKAQTWEVTYAQPPDLFYTYRAVATSKGVPYYWEVKVGRQNTCGGCTDEPAPLPPAPPEPEPPTIPEPEPEPGPQPIPEPLPLPATCTLEALEVTWPGWSPTGDTAVATIALRDGYQGTVEVVMRSLRWPEGEQLHETKWTAPGRQDIHGPHDARVQWSATLTCGDGRLLSATP